MDKGPRDDRWYLRLMAPNTKGGRFAWLDPHVHLHQQGPRFTTCWTTCTPTWRVSRSMSSRGWDAMGFVLGGALAARRGVGFLPIRKAGKLCVDTDSVAFTNYSGRTQDMEMRLPAFAPATRVLLVDQWIETGGDNGRRHCPRRTSEGAGSPVWPPSPSKARSAPQRSARSIVASPPSCPARTGSGSAMPKILSSFAEYRPEHAFPALTGGSRPPPSRRLVGEVGGEPAFGFGERHALAPGVVLHLVAVDPSDAEISRLRV